MKKASLLKEERAAKMAELQGIVQAARSENREMSTEEETRFDTLEQEIEVMNGLITRAEKVEAMEAQAAANEARTSGLGGNQSDSTILGNNRSDTIVDSTNVGNGEQRELQNLANRYSFFRSARHLFSQGGRSLDGVEAEAHQIALKEARDANIEFHPGSVAIPESFVKVHRSKEYRDVTVTAQGTNVVETNLGQIIPILRPRLLIGELGTRILTGLRGDVDLPKQTGKTTATWEGEQTTVPKSQVNTGKVSLSPKRIAAHTAITDKMLRQASFDIEALVREDIEKSIAEKLDETAINGSGSGNIPLGILNFPNINVVAIDTNGGELTRSHLIKMNTAVANANVNRTGGYYISTPSVEGALRDKKVDAGSGVFILGNDNLLVGYNSMFTTQVPSNLTKGSGTNLHAMIFGVFDSLILGQWGGMSMIFDPYTSAKEATSNITVHTFWDIASRYEQAFAVAKDVVVPA